MASCDNEMHSHLLTRVIVANGTGGVSNEQRTTNRLYSHRHQDHRLRIAAWLAVYRDLQSPVNVAWAYRDYKHLFHNAGHGPRDAAAARLDYQSGHGL